MNQEKMWSISDVNSAVREILENSLMPFWIQGEVGTLNIHRSGHVYLTLKDSKTQIKAVLWSGAELARKIELKVGMSVEAFGKLTVYETRGEYQLALKKIRPVGMGNLQQRFEELKQKLMAEGLFEQERKKAIPLLPLRVGVITSPDGAAIRDFLQIVNRRFPDLNVKIYPASVQGKGAEKQVADGVRFFNNTKCVDIIVITRGGGSMEDLWPFNEEILARAVADSDLPVVSAVGHEVDFTICDFVADLRVPTPSSAAELVIGKQEEFAEFLRNSQRRMKTTLELVYERYSKRLRLAAESYVFREPKHVLREKQQQLDEASKNMTVAMSRFSEQYKMKYAGISGRLKALSPVNVLKRGYAVITDKESGKILTSPEVSAGTKLRAYVNQGQINLCSEGGKKKDLNEILFDLTHKND